MHGMSPAYAHTSWPDKAEADRSTNEKARGDPKAVRGGSRNCAPARLMSTINRCLPGPLQTEKNSAPAFPSFCTGRTSPHFQSSAPSRASVRALCLSWGSPYDGISLSSSALGSVSLNIHFSHSITWGTARRTGMPALPPRSGKLNSCKTIGTTCPRVGPPTLLLVAPPLAWRSRANAASSA